MYELQIHLVLAIPWVPEIHPEEKVPFGPWMQDWFTYFTLTW